MKSLYIGPSSACFELSCDTPYDSPESYEVLLDARCVYQGSTNVFSVFDLHPDTAYTVVLRKADGSEISCSFTTPSETCCLNVRDFGAVGDGQHEDTAVLQAAINFLPEGGRLYFPPGRYLTLPLSLKSHITLEFAEGAVLLGSTERERYPILPGVVSDMEEGREVPYSAFEGIEMPMYQSLLHGCYAEDIRIVGRGRIDGNAPKGDWWKNFKSFPAARPRILFLNRCRGFVMHGVTIADSPSWNLHPYFSEDLAFYDCFVTAPKNSPNTDALDPESCSGVQIIGCRFSVGDDCIAIKSGKIDLGRKYKTPASSHTIRNCLMEFGHGAVTLGSEAAAGVEDLSVTQCLFRSTDRGLRIKSRRGRGKDSVITRVTFENIRMDCVLTPIVINMWYNCCDPDRFTEYVWSREKLPVDDRTPHLGEFTFRNMECTNCEVAGCYIDGLPESPIDSVTLENIHLTYSPDAKPGVPAMQNFAEQRCRLGLYFDFVKKIRIHGVSLEGVEGEPLLASHYETLESDLT